VEIFCLTKKINYRIKKFIHSSDNVHQAGEKILDANVFHGEHNEEQATNAQTPDQCPLDQSVFSVGRPHSIAEPDPATVVVDPGAEIVFDDVGHAFHQFG
jgi:hypothetical protein